jgi:hypothetical protein
MPFMSFAIMMTGSLPEPPALRSAAFWLYMTKTVMSRKLAATNCAPTNTAATNFEPDFKRLLRKPCAGAIRLNTTPG